MVGGRQAVPHVTTGLSHPHLRLAGSPWGPQGFPTPSGQKMGITSLCEILTGSNGEVLLTVKDPKGSHGAGGRQAEDQSEAT